MNVTLLSEVANITMGQSPPSSTYNDEGKGLPFFQGKTDFSDMYPRIRIYCDTPNKIAQKGDILISVRAPVGPTNICPSKSCIGRGLAAIRGNSRIDAQYLLYFLRFVEPELAETGRGSTFGAISRTDLENIKVPLFSPTEQKRLAAILAKADRLRRLRRYALAVSDTYLQTVFLELFGDPLANSKSWNVAPVEDIGEVQGGLQISSKRDTLNRKAPYLRVANVYRDRLELSEVKSLGLTDGEFERAKLQAGDILIVEGHGNAEEIGRAAIWNGSIKNCVHQNHLIRVRSLPDTVSNVFLSRYLNSEGGKKYFQNASNTTSGLNTISTGIVKNCLVLLPPLPLQQKFAQIVQKHERLCAQQREAARQAEGLFGALLHRAFRGELSGAVPA